MIIIHRGGPYGGHYHAYIRDDLNEGVWNLKMPDKFAEAPTEVVKSNEKDKKEQDGDDGKAAQPENPQPAEEEKKDEEEESPKDLSKMSKRARKRYNEKKNKQNKKKNQNNNNNQQQKKKKDQVDLDYTQCDFPLPYSDIELGKHFFDFNDSTVDPIMPGQLQKMFGGTNANAYMLVYRQRKLTKDAEAKQQVPIPSYWISEIEKINNDESELR